MAGKKAARKAPKVTKSPYRSQSSDEEEVTASASFFVGDDDSSSSDGGEAGGGDDDAMMDDDASSDEEAPAALEQPKEARGLRGARGACGARPRRRTRTAAAEEEVDWATLCENVRLDRRLARAVAELNWARPSLIQQALPVAATGATCSSARTGSGKTACYALPILDLILKKKAETLEGRREWRRARGAGAAEQRRHDDHPLLRLRRTCRAYAVDEADLVLSFGYDEDVAFVAGLGVAATRLDRGPPQGFLLSATLGDDVLKLKKLALKGAATVKLDERAGVFGGDRDDLCRWRRGSTPSSLQPGLYDILVATDASVEATVRGDDSDDDAPDIDDASDADAPEKRKRGQKKATRRRRSRRTPSASPGASISGTSTARGTALSLVVADDPGATTARGSRPSGGAAAHEAQRRSRRRRRGAVALRRQRAALGAGAHVPQPARLAFDGGACEPFRYRVSDVQRGVTAASVRDARAAELRKEMLDSEALKAHFSDNPDDLAVLQQTKAEHHASQVPSTNSEKVMERIA
ncbi:helicase [Aureococcus anophagefferens]|nr:helicase [Aureococcus anophagefferens]